MPQSRPDEILIATKNRGKVDELRRLLQGLPLTLRDLLHFPDVPDVDETGTTFAENAVLKAVEYGRRTGLWAVADDSGLEVDGLGGEPGVYSARYGGESLTPGARNALLLDRLGDTDFRRARFVCSVALADAGGEILFAAEGICSGSISREPRGTNGFGYDPIFVPDGFEETFGELPDAVKQQISHRAAASALLIRYLLHFNAV